MYKFGSVAVYRKLLIIFRMPLFLIIFTVISAAILVLSALEKGFSLPDMKYRVKSALSHRFKGGVHVPYNKVTSKMAIETLPPAKIIAIFTAKILSVIQINWLIAYEYYQGGQKTPSDTNLFGFLFFRFQIAEYQTGNIVSFLLFFL